MTTCKFISFLRPIVLILITTQHKLLAAYCTNISLQTSAWKATFTCVLNKTTKRDISNTRIYHTFISYFLVCDQMASACTALADTAHVYVFTKKPLLQYHKVKKRTVTVDLPPLIRPLPTVCLACE